MKVAIVDDQIEMANQIKGLILSSFGNLEASVFLSGEELLQQDVKQFSIVFLDIELDGISGLETAKKLKRINKTAAIFFVTSYTTYITAALRTFPFQYIVKPIDESVFIKELERAVKNVKKLNAKIEVSRYGQKQLINISDIHFVEYRYRLVSFVLEGGERVECSNSFNLVVEKLNDFDICRCHNSFLVNLKYIATIPAYEIVLNDNTTLPISKKFYKEIRERYRQYISGVKI